MIIIFSMADYLLTAIIVALVFAFPLIKALSLCPMDEIILPCICQHRTAFTNITCKGEGKDIVSGLENIGKIWFGANLLTLQSNSITVLKKKQFGLMEIISLRLFTPNLRLIDSDAFRTMERRLRELLIFESIIENIDDVLPSLTDIFRLNTLLINKSPMLKGISDNAFTNNFKGDFLTVLNLDNNNIASIGDNAFSGLTRLKILSLNNNKLTSFAGSYIPEGNYITDIMLQ